MSGVAVAIGGAAVIGGVGAYMSSNAASDAAAMQKDAAFGSIGLQREMLAEQKRQYDQARSDAEPWRQAGAGALSELGSGDFKRDFTAADFTKDPGYEFRMAEGQKALERSAAAKGGLMGGGTLKALSRYGQDYASNEYQNVYNRFNADRDRRFNRLSNIAGLGQTANGQLLNAGANYTNASGNASGRMSDALMGAANAQGAAGMASANAWSGAMNNTSNLAGQYAMMNAYKPGKV